MKKLQKSIVTILIIGLVLSLNFNIFKPKQAQALVDVIGGPSQVANTIKDLLLDTIGHTITQSILTVLKQKIMDWGQGRKSTSNVPFAVTDWVQFFKNAATRGAAKFISEQYENLFDLTDPFEAKLRVTLDFLGSNLYPEDWTYSQYAKPTLRNVLETVGVDYPEFVDSGYSIARGGWDSWFALMQPQNNVFGQAIMAEQEKARRMLEEKEAADKETDVSGGYQNETTATKTDIEVCEEKCAEAGPPSPACLQRCERLPGVVIQTQIKNWGSDIHELMTKSLGADIDRLISVDEITELMGVLFSAVLNKAVNQGLAWGTKALNTISSRTRTETKTTFSYQRKFKEEQTIADIKDVRTQTLSDILKSIQQLSRTITKCETTDDDKMVRYDDFAKNLDDIFSPSVEALYIGLEGVNLKPDFEVLDSRFAPYIVYGYSWGHVPVSKFPEKCQNITDQLDLGSNATCRSIESGLEPNIHSRCEVCMYDHDSLNCPPAPYPPRTYPTTGIEPWNETILEQKSDYWWDCKNQYNITHNRCDECLKNADEKCQQIDDPAQKNQCIIDQCGNFSDISGNFVTPLPVDSDLAALEFHDRCLKEEAKDACYTCLKEYFMPATYCEQTFDYTARALIKYPAPIKLIRNNAPNHEIWIGLYDETLGEMLGGGCDNNNEAESIDLSLICRILPDFSHNGQRVCRARCPGASEEELNNVTDFRPNSQDCSGIKLPIGGKEPWASIRDGVFHTRAKCCGALHPHDARKYAVCVGSDATIPEFIIGGEGEEPKPPVGGEEPEPEEPEPPAREM